MLQGEMGGRRQRMRADAVPEIVVRGIGPAPEVPPRRDQTELYRITVQRDPPSNYTYRYFQLILVTTSVLISRLCLPCIVTWHFDIASGIVLFP
jgi:hypothetical protein